MSRSLAFFLNFFSCDNVQISHSNSHHFLVALSQWLFNKQSAFSCTFWQGHFGSLKYLPCLNLLSVQIKNKSVLTIKGEKSMINILMKTFSSCLFLRPNSYKRPIAFWVTPSCLSHAKAAWQNIFKVIYFSFSKYSTDQLISRKSRAHMALVMTGREEITKAHPRSSTYDKTLPFTGHSQQWKYL